MKPVALGIVVGAIAIQVAGVVIPARETRLAARSPEYPALGASIDRRRDSHHVVARSASGAHAKTPYRPDRQKLGDGWAIHCFNIIHPYWGSGLNTDEELIGPQIGELKDRGKEKKTINAGKCDRIRCNANAAIFLCNRSDKEMTLTRNEVAAAAEHVAKICHNIKQDGTKAASDEWSSIGGLADKGDWEIKVQRDAC